MDTGVDVLYTGKAVEETEVGAADVVAFTTGQGPHSSVSFQSHERVESNLDT